MLYEDCEHRHRTTSWVLALGNAGVLRGRDVRDVTLLVLRLLNTLHAIR